jgi:hypothetical protein
MTNQTKQTNQINEAGELTHLLTLEGDRKSVV